jgi:carbon-monoxide dehydrogenase small subunit
MFEAVELNWVLTLNSGPSSHAPLRLFNHKETSMQVQLKVNGKPVTVDAAPHTLLVQTIREHLKLTGTHVGCDTAQCGACTVMVDGRAIKSCNVLLAQVAGSEVTTIEGLAQADGTMHPMQAAFKDCHGLQCGFCTPGMVMSSVSLCKQHPKASATEIRELLEGNLCRCTGYQNIVKAVQQGAAGMKA